MRFEAGQELPCYEVIAKNYGADHANKIHSDEGATRYGFAGALVPGVGLYAYLARPAVDALGREWLERGAMSAKFIKPVYDGEKVQARATTSNNDPVELRLELFNSAGNLCAIGSAGLPDSATAPDPNEYPFSAHAQLRPASIASFSIGCALGSFEFDLDLKGRNAEVSRQCRRDCADLRFRLPSGFLDRAGQRNSDAQHRARPVDSYRERYAELRNCARRGAAVGSRAS